MTDETSAALDHVRNCATWDGGNLDPEYARAILAHIAALTERAEKAGAAAKDWSLQADKLARALDRRPTDADLNALAAQVARLRAALERAITYVELTYDEEHGEEAAGAKHDLDLCRQALRARPQKEKKDE